MAKDIASNVINEPIRPLSPPPELELNIFRAPC